MELTINIDIRKKEAKVFLEYLKTLSFIEIKNTNEPNDETLTAMNEIHDAKTTTINGNDKLSDFLNQI